MRRKTLLIAGSVGLLMGSLAAQTLPPPRTASAAPTVPSFKAEFLFQLDDLETKFVRLAEAIPQERYSWRPGEGVRSIGEVYTHVAGTNYGFMMDLGMVLPEGYKNLRSFTILKEKAQIVAALRQSFANMRAAVNALPPDMDRTVKLFGRETSARNVLYIVSLHITEHLGQSIAYSRSVGTIPPWTADLETKQAAPKASEPEKK